jgi:hypothetical protein
MVDTLATVITLALGVFGISFMLFYTDGPYDVFRTARRHLQYNLEPVYDEDRRQVDIIEESKEGFFPGVLSCFWCFSLWIALISITLIWVLTREWTIIEYIVILMASYGLCGFIHERIANG